MAVTPEHANETVRFLDDDESRQFFDRQARRLIGMGGEEFLRRLDAGEFEDVADDRTRHAVMKLKMLSSFGR